jgi:hypothetical protein
MTDERPTDARVTDDHDVSARQLLHAATGDRDAEAGALAAENDADPDAAKLAVKRAHGDVSDAPKVESDLASPDDVRNASDSDRSDPAPSR